MVIKNRDKLIANGTTKALQQKRRDVLDIIEAALEAINPYKAVQSCFQNSVLTLPTETITCSDFDHIYVVGFGKAAIGMVQAVVDAIPIAKGVAVTNDPDGLILHLSLIHI